jgi:hypothetical protein
LDEFIALVKCCGSCVSISSVPQPGVTYILSFQLARTVRRFPRCAFHESRCTVALLRNLGTARR